MTLFKDRHFKHGIRKKKHQYRMLEYIRLPFLTVIVFFIFSSISLLHAQFLPLGNPSDTEILESSYTNPAVTGFIDNRLSTGLLIHHAGFTGGFADLKTTYFNYHLPWKMRWFEVSGQFFTPDRYSNSTITFNTAYCYRDLLSAGVGLGINSMSFDPGDFNLVEPGDPVLESNNGKTYLSISAGAMAWPMPELMVGMSLQNLNRPNLSLIDDPDVVQPTRLSMGVTYLGRKYRVGVAYLGQELGRKEVYGNPAKFEVQLAAIPNEKIPLFFSASTTEITAEGRFQVYPGLFVSYTFDYPFSDIHSFSSGSHRLGVIWDLDYLPLLPGKMPPTHIRRDVEHGGGKGRHHKFFYAYANNDSLYIHQRNFRREVDKDELSKVARLLDANEIDAIYSIERGEPVPRTSEPLEVQDPLLKLDGTYTSSYLGALGDMSARMRAESKAESDIIAYPGSQKRAVSIMNYITGAEDSIKDRTAAYIAMVPDSISPTVLDSLLNLPNQETVIDVFPDSLRFTVLGIHMTGYTDPWTLTIVDSKDRPVHEIKGSPNLIDRQIVWDWRLSDGSYIPPGEYSFFIRWVDSDGKVRQSSRRFFKVVKRVTTLTIEVTREAKPDRGKGDLYHLHLSE